MLQLLEQITSELSPHAARDIVKSVVHDGYYSAKQSARQLLEVARVDGIDAVSAAGKPEIVRVATR